MRKPTLWDSAEKRAERSRRWLANHRGLHNSRQNARRRLQRIARRIAAFKSDSVTLS